MRIGDVISHYNIMEKVGEGGMSQNFLRAQQVVEVLQIPLERNGSGRCGL